MKSRVGLVTQWYDPERASAAQSGVIARSLVAQGHDVDVVTGFPNYPTGKIYDGYSLKLYQHDVEGGVRIHRGPLYPSHDANAARRSMNYLSFALAATGVALLRLRHVDVCLVHATPATASVPAMVMRRLRGLPYVVHIHDLWPDSVLASGFLSTWQSRLAKRALHTFCDSMYKHAAAIAVTSPGMADRIAQRGVPRSKIHFVPNWADEEVFEPTEVDQQLRRELGLVAPTTVMYAGNLGEYQDLRTVVDAAALLRDRADIQFVFVGEGVQRSNLEKHVADLGLSNVVFTGPRTFAEMPRMLTLGDLQLITLADLAMFATTLPSKLVATLATRRPVLGALIGDAAELVRRSGAGEVVPPGCPRQMAAAIDRFSQLDPAERDRRAAAGLSHYHEHLDRHIVAERLSNLLEDVARREVRR